MSNASTFNNSLQTYQNNLAAQQGQLGQQMGSNLSGINNQLGWYNQMVGQTSMPQYVSQAADQASSMMDQYQKSLSGIMANPGYSAAEKQGMTSATADPIASAYGTAQYQTQNDAAKTGNAGAAAAGSAALARGKARDMSTALGGLQGQFGQARMNNQMQGLQASSLPLQYANQTLQGQQNNSQLFQFPATLQANMYGQNLNAQQNTLEQQGNANNMLLQRAQKPGFLATAAQTAIGGLTGGAVAPGGKLAGY